MVQGLTKLRKPQDLAEVIEEIREERAGNRDFLTDDPDKFRLQMMPGSRSGYGLEIKGQLAPMGNDGVKSLCRWLGMDYRYFTRFPSKNELVEHAKVLLPSRMREDKGALIRLTTDGAIRAVLPGNYTVFDDEQVLDLVHSLGSQTLGKLRGIVVASSQWDASIYRLLFGDSMLDRDEIYSCVNIRNSEVGGPLSFGFGTLRVICTNGMMDQTSHGKILSWSHRGEFDKAQSKLGAAFRASDHWFDSIQGRVKRSKSVKLEHPGQEISRMERGGWINSEFAENAKSHLAEDLKFGGEHGGATKYGVWNALTAAARMYRPRARAKWEGVAHRYLMLNS